MDEMMSPYVLQPNTFLYASFGLLLVQGFLFSFECLWRTLTGTTPRAQWSLHPRTRVCVVCACVRVCRSRVLMYGLNSTAHTDTDQPTIPGRPTRITTTTFATFALLRPRCLAVSLTHTHAHRRTRTRTCVVLLCSEPGRCLWWCSRCSPSGTSPRWSCSSVTLRP